MKEQERISAADWRRDARKSVPESAVQQQICRYLTARQIPHTVTDAALTYNRQGKRVVRVSSGWPDVTACLPGGQLLAIECKRPVGGRLRYEQAVTLAHLQQQGAIVVIARDLVEVETAIRLRVTPAATQDEIGKAMARGPEAVKRSAPRRIAAK